MPIQQHSMDHFIVAHWGLGGNNNNTNPAEYRSDNPWQSLESYMEGNRGDAAQFFADHSASPTRIDTGGSVWRVDVTRFPTAGGLAIDEFAKELLGRLVQQLSTQHQRDYIRVSYAGSLIGWYDWSP